MLIEQLELVNFRNYESNRFHFSGDRVVLTGPNGAGKTNLLESIFFLSILRSFRTVSGREMVRIGSRGFELRGRIAGNGMREELRVVQALSGRRETFVGPNRIRRSSEFIREFRAVVFVPEDRNITGGSSAVAAAFEPELAATAPLIAARRREYAAAVENEVNRMPAMREKGEFRINFRCDYPESSAEYLALLERNRHREMIRSCTGIGPQLDDFEFSLNGKLLRHYGSTGQIRMISLLVKLAEFNLVRRSAREPVAVLVDDVTGELDEENRFRFFETIAGADQLFFTFTEFPAQEFFQDAERIMLPQREG